MEIQVFFFFTFLTVMNIVAIITYMQAFCGDMFSFFYLKLYEQKDG